MKTLLTSNQIGSMIDTLKTRYGTLWPLQTFNACNPLVAYEHLPFNEALRQAETELCFSSQRSIEVLKRLFQKQVYTKQDILGVLDRYCPNRSENRVSIATSSLSYRDLWEEELLHRVSGHHSDKGEDLWAFETGKELKIHIQCYADKEAEARLSLGQNRQMQWINEQVTKWLAAYLDDGQALWKMPGKNKSFRVAWMDLAIYDTQLPKPVKTELQALISSVVIAEENSLDCLRNLIDFRSLDAEQAEQLIDSHLKELPGWVGYIEYVRQNNAACEDLLYDYLLVRLAYHFALEKHPFYRQESISGDENHPLCSHFNVLSELDRFKEMPVDARAKAFLNHFDQWMDYIESFPEYEQLTILITALEEAQRRPLSRFLGKAYAAYDSTNNLPHHKPSAQAVFCIDVRSEPYRRALESAGNIETYGFAGFFGLPISKMPYASHEPVPLCPILLKPQFTVAEGLSESYTANPLSKLVLEAIPVRQQWIYALKKIKRDTFATFTYVEGLGMVHAFTLLRDSFASVSFGQFGQKVSSAIQSLAQCMPQLEANSSDGSVSTGGIPVTVQAELAKTILPLIGLKTPYAEFVIICGHAAKTRNNPYASALDCGACGSNGGGFNALVLCQILNNPAVREALAVEGIQFPETTRFIAAEHNTTTDAISFLNLHVIPDQQQSHFIPVKEAFEQASNQNRLQRQEKLKKQAPVSCGNNPLAPAYDWSQTRPEWGLAQNQAFIIGERAAIKKLNLEGRCFLHSYNWREDPQGEVLKVIMTAPMVVGTWINLQYNFSTLDQHRFGSGKKYLHNIVGLFGSYIGNASDLQVGLPYESLFCNDGTPFHYPQRLLVHIQAPLDRVSSIIEQHGSVKNLVANQWIKVMVFDPEKNKIYESTQDGWQICFSDSGIMPALCLQQ